MEKEVNQIKKTLRQAFSKNIYNKKIEIYLFGSTLKNDFNQDIDILVVYSTKNIIPRIIKEFEQLKLNSLDLSLYNEKELKEFGFLDKMEYLKII